MYLIDIKLRCSAQFWNPILTTFDHFIYLGFNVYIRIKSVYKFP